MDIMHAFLSSHSVTVTHLLDVQAKHLVGWLWNQKIKTLDHGLKLWLVYLKELWPSC